jgi:uncharacterized protein YajQ (UPF0234 family)
MPSFDAVSKLDMQLMDNAINVTRKELQNRYDLKDAKVEIDLDKKEEVVKLSASNDMALDSVIDILISRMVKQGVDGTCLDYSKESYPSGPLVKRELALRTGIEKDIAKKMVKLVKDSGLKVQAAIMDDMVRVTGKKVDDLQEAIALFRASDLGIPLQFVNMKS